MLPLISSCDSDKIYRLGPYEIKKDEYAYLMGMHKKKLLEAIGLDERYINEPISPTDTTTYGEYLEKRYREEFEQSVYTMLFSLALFDEYGLELTDAQKTNIRSTASAIVFEFGGGSTGVFDDIAEPYGFSSHTLYSIYEKQAKESLVIEYLFGDDYSKLNDEQKNDYYKESYLHFQVIVVNTLYKKSESSTGKIIYSNLSEEQRKVQLQLEKEIGLFLCQEDKNYKYQLLPAIIGKDISEITYEDIWSCKSINDDMTYPQGYYMLEPGINQFMTANTLSVAYMTKEGDVSLTPAKKYFEGGGEIKLPDGSETVKEGDYFEYGTAFIKRLPLDDDAWKRAENETFFKDSNFVVGSAQYALFRTLQTYEESCSYTLMVNEDEKARFSLETIPANEIDYYYFYQKAEG